MLKRQVKRLRVVKPWWDTPTNCWSPTLDGASSNSIVGDQRRFHHPRVASFLQSKLDMCWLHTQKHKLNQRTIVGSALFRTYLHSPLKRGVNLIPCECTYPCSCRGNHNHNHNHNHPQANTPHNVYNIAITLLSM